MKHFMLMLAVALAAACNGSNVTGDRPNVTPETDASVTPQTDGGNPTPDAGQSDSPITPRADAAIDPDVPPPPVDTPAAMMSPCQGPMCSDQSIVSDDGRTNIERAEMTCAMTTDGLTIDLAPYGIQAIAVCNQTMNVCGAETRVRTIAMDGTTITVHARFQIQRDMSMMTCSPCGRFTLMSMEEDGRMISSGMTCMAR